MVVHRAHPEAGPDAVGAHARELGLKGGVVLAAVEVHGPEGRPLGDLALWGRRRWCGVCHRAPLIVSGSVCSLRMGAHMAGDTRA